MKWTKEEEILLHAFVEANYAYKDIANELDRTYRSIRGKTQKLRISNNATKQFTNENFLKLLKEKSPRVVALEDYKGITVPILFKCLDCSSEYKAMPKSKLNGYKCKYCGYNNNGGDIPLNKEGITYLVYIPKYRLYKIGITSKTIKERMCDNNIREYEIILEHKFKYGKDAIKLEKDWKENLKDYLVNTGLLRTGNTETFRI